MNETYAALVLGLVEQQNHSVVGTAAGTNETYARMVLRLFEQREPLVGTAMTVDEIVDGLAPSRLVGIVGQGISAGSKLGWFGTSACEVRLTEAGLVQMVGTIHPAENGIPMRS